MVNGPFSQSACVHSLRACAHQHHFRSEKCIARPPNAGKEAAEKTMSPQRHVGVKSIPDAYDERAEAKVEDAKGPANLRPLGPVKRRIAMGSTVTWEILHL